MEGIPESTTKKDRKSIQNVQSSYIYNLQKGMPELIRVSKKCLNISVIG